MDIWEQYPNYSNDDLRILVKSAAITLYDAAEENSELDPELFECGPNSIAMQLRECLLGQIGAGELDKIGRMLSDNARARELCLAVLDEVRQNRALAEKIAEAYARERNKMTGVEVLLAGVLLLLAARIKRIRLPNHTEIDFIEVNKNVASLIAKVGSSMIST